MATIIALANVQVLLRHVTNVSCGWAGEWQLPCIGRNFFEFTIVLARKLVERAHIEFSPRDLRAVVIKRDYPIVHAPGFVREFEQARLIVLKRVMPKSIGAPLGLG